MRIEILTDAVDLVSYPPTPIYNASLKKGIFTQVWKLTRVKHIHKAVSKTDVNNYRPISVSSVV